MARPSLECGDHFMKYVLFFFNLVILLLSAALLALGITMLMKYTFITDMMQMGPLLKLLPPSVYKGVAWGIIGIGAVMLFISFTGCCGAISESHCMVLMYAVTLLVIIFVEVTVGVVVYTQRDNLINKNIDELANAIGNVSELLAARNIYIDNIPEIVKNILPKQMLTFIELTVTVQKEFHCCGIRGPSDFSVDNSTTTLLPKFCCPEGTVPCKLEKSFMGCWAKVEGSMTLILGSAIGFVCVQLLTSIFGLCLVNAIKNMESRD